MTFYPIRKDEPAFLHRGLAKKDICAAGIPRSSPSLPNQQKEQKHSQKMPFELPKLTYDYNALEPFVDTNTMNIHHTKHHQGYVNNINNYVTSVRFNL
jgi:hypothetical protein